VRLERPALAVALAVQPVVFGEALATPAAVRRGLLARYMTCAPPSRMGDRAIDPPSIPEGLRDQAWTAPLRRMLDWPMPDPDAEPIVARLDDEGRRAFGRFRERHENRLCPKTGDLAATDADAAWGSKLPGAIARLALVLACWDAATRGEDPPAAVDAGSIVAALGWADWLIEARRLAEAVALAAVDPEAGGAADGLTPDQRTLTAWIRGRAGPVTPRDVARSLKRFGGPGGSDRARAALEELADAGAGTLAYSGGGGKGPDVLAFTLANPADADKYGSRDRKTWNLSASAPPPPQNADGWGLV